MDALPRQARARRRRPPLPSPRGGAQPRWGALTPPPWRPAAAQRRHLGRGSAKACGEAAGARRACAEGTRRALPGRPSPSNGHAAAYGHGAACAPPVPGPAPSPALPQPGGLCAPQPGEPGPGDPPWPQPHGPRPMVPPGPGVSLPHLGVPVLIPPSPAVLSPPTPPARRFLPPIASAPFPLQRAVGPAQPPQHTHPRTQGRAKDPGQPPAMAGQGDTLLGGE